LNFKHASVISMP